MKLMMILSIIVMGPALAGCGTGKPTNPPATPALDSDTAAPPPTAANNIVLMVSGFACPFCANKLDHQMLKIAGVQEVIIDLSTGAVQVVADPDNLPTRDAIVQAVEDAGFTLNRVTFPE